MGLLQRDSTPGGSVMVRSLDSVIAQSRVVQGSPSLRPVRDTPFPSPAPWWLRLDPEGLVGPTEQSGSSNPAPTFSSWSRVGRLTLCLFSSLPYLQLLLPFGEDSRPSWRSLLHPGGGCEAQLGLRVSPGVTLPCPLPSLGS